MSNPRWDLALAIYREMAGNDTTRPGDSSPTRQMSEREMLSGIELLKELGLLVPAASGGGLIPVPPESALVRLLRESRTSIGAHYEEIGRLRDRMDHLVEDFMPLATSPTSDIRIDIFTEPSRIATALDEFTEQTTEGILSMHPGPVPPKELIQDAYPRSRMLAERGLRLRSIYLQRMVVVPYVLENLRQLTRLRYEIRIAPVLPVRMIISDSRSVVIPVDPDDGTAGAIMITGSTLVRSFVRMFNYFWSHSSDLEDVSAHRPTGPLSMEEQAILKMLAQGMKDETIARSIGSSRRTVARIVADLMVRLDAESRFQAGVRATRLGWLD